jgi:hypothetical protein
MIIPRRGILAVNNDGMTVKENDCALNDCWYVSKVSVNDFSLILLAIKVFHLHINPKRSYWVAVDLKRQVTCSLPYLRNERQRSVTDFWSCILDND